MDRTIYINIAGKNYPMRFSLAALREINQKYGNLQKMTESIDQDNTMNTLNALTGMLELLIRQGCAYKNLFEKDIPAPEGAATENGTWIPISAENLEVAIELNDIATVKEKIFECIRVGQKQTIESEPADKKSKNAKAT